MLGEGFVSEVVTNLTIIEGIVMTKLTVEVGIYTVEGVWGRGG